MKRILFALMAIVAIAMTGAFVGCEEKGEPNPDDNRPSRFDTTSSDTTPSYPSINLWT